ncbi:hypothetical protein POM88_020037 [Heracleum sosnowskyi]|uniref:Uncharacterized protein n=1 Tax=Heracleum sosnowskyi TaxID=360622 RepID=A0AAD8ID29_9APIA|nr:hypothetical protein POM88_020037 [Heracleum sosnowskyi]
MWELNMVPNVFQKLKTLYMSESFFQMYSEFGHPIRIFSTKFPHWISQSSESELIGLSHGYQEFSLNLPTNVQHKYLGMVLCIRSSKRFTDYNVENNRYSVKKNTSHCRWSGTFDCSGAKSLMVILPRSAFAVKDGDRIKLIPSRDAKPCGIHLLYQTEEYDSTTVNED